MERSARLHALGSPYDRPAAGIAFDWAVTAAGAWLMVGAYLDAWAHNHIPSLETFFTPWHGVLYSGFGAVTLVLLVGLFRSHAPGQPWAQAIPRGYGPAYVGIIVFLLAGLGDMTWHEILGIEVNVEALVSPTHLALAVGSGLMLTSPFRAAWLRAPGRGGIRSADLWPAVLSLAYLLSILSFFTFMFHPLSRPWPALGNEPVGGFMRLAAPNPSLPANPSGIGVEEAAQIMGLATLLVQGAILAGIALLAVRRWGTRLPIGAFTVIFTVSTLLMGFARDELSLAPVGFLGGVAADVLSRWLRPSLESSGRLRLFGLMVPAVYVAVFFGYLRLTMGGTWWTPPLWAGGIFYAGIAGLLESFLVAPPAVPVESAEERPSESEERAA